MKIAILTAHDPAGGHQNTAGKALSAIRPDTLPPGAIVLKSSGTLLKALEAATGFDGLILIDGASMGMPTGSARVFSLNDLILPGSPTRVKFDNVDIEGDILYANKFLSLPPVRIVGIQPGEERAGMIGSCLDAIRQAFGELEGMK